MTPTLSSTPDGRLQRRLSARQVQMIAIAGTLGTGIFLGTGRSLASGGPASMLICYLIVGFIVYVTLLLLGEMATQYPVAGASTVPFTKVRPNITCRFVQRIRDPLFLPLLRICARVELLVQRCGLDGLRPHGCSASARILDF
jgi:hypothetical protein